MTSFKNNHYHDHCRVSIFIIKLLCLVLWYILLHGGVLMTRQHIDPGKFLYGLWLLYKKRCHNIAACFVLVKKCTSAYVLSLQKDATIVLFLQKDATIVSFVFQTLPIKHQNMETNIANMDRKKSNGSSSMFGSLDVGKKNRNPLIPNKLYCIMDGKPLASWWC